MKTIKKAQNGIVKDSTKTKVKQVGAEGRNRGSVAVGGSIKLDDKPKVTPKKPKTASQRIGDLTLRDVKNSAETALNLSTLGGYGAVKKGVKKLTGMKTGGTMKKAKSGAKFDLNKDGKTTFKDVLIGRGVLPKTAKAGAKMKKCKTGCK